MKSLILLVVVLLFASVPSRAMSLEEAAEILKLDNEQIVARIPEDAAAAAVVADLQKGEAVSPERLQSAESYCLNVLVGIDTKKKRKGALKEMMVSVKSTLEAWAWKGGSADRYYEARMHSARISRKLSSLLEFEAGRYTNFLEVIKSRK